MMNPKISLTSPITPEIKTQGCASVQQKGWENSLDLVLLLFTQEFPSSDRTGWSPFIIFQPADN